MTEEQNDGILSVVRMRNIRLLFIVGALSCAGFGCSKPPVAAPTQAPQSTSQAPVPFPTFVPEEKALTTKEELSQILKNYNATKSFRASIHTKTPDGEYVGAMEFAKPDRFHALIRTGPKNDTELIIVGNNLYMKEQDKAWKDLSSSRGSRTLGEAMRSALTENTLDQLVLSDAVTVEKSDDSVRSCALYTTQITNQSGTRQIQICAAEGLPKFLEVTLKDGSNTIEYFDFNEVFSIYKPLP